MNILVIIKGEDKNQRKFINVSFPFMLSLLENLELGYVLNGWFNYYLNVVLLLLISNFITLYTEDIIYVLSVLSHLF